MCLSRLFKPGGFSRLLEEIDFRIEIQIDISECGVSFAVFAGRQPIIGQDSNSALCAAPKRPHSSTPEQRDM
jgi:hypothetical protein